MQHTSASVSSADLSASSFPLRPLSIRAGQTSAGLASPVEGHLCDSPTSPSSCCEPSGGGDVPCISSSSVCRISSIPSKLGLPSSSAASTQRFSSFSTETGDSRPREGVKARGSGTCSLTLPLILLPNSPSVQASPASPDSDVPAASGGWSQALVSWACKAAETACPGQPHDRGRPTSPGPAGSHASVDGPLKAAGLDKESLVVRRLDDLSPCAAARSWRFMPAKVC